MPVTGLYSVGKSARNLIGRLFIYILAQGLLGYRVYQLQQLLNLAAVDTGSSFFIFVVLLYFAVFCHILLAIIFYYILLSFAVDTGRFKRVKDRERIGVINVY